MLKFLRRGATFIQGGTSIPESRVLKHLNLCEQDDIYVYILKRAIKYFFYNSFTTNFLSLATPEAEATLNGLNHINSQHTYVLIFRSTASIA